MDPGVTIATDDRVANLVRGAVRELVVLAPAVTETVARAIADRWRVLGSSVQVILDSDPEVYRLGLGHESALRILEEAAHEAGSVLRKQPGTRIAIVIADGQTLIYAPTPQLIEAGPNTRGAANAILLGSAPSRVAQDLGLATTEPPRIGRSALTQENTAAIKKDLTDNPPQKFDIARRLRVFNTYFEFVELRVIGTQVSKKTVSIPQHILGVLDANARAQLRTSLRLVPDGHALSGEHLLSDRDLIEQQYMTVIPRFGTVIKAADKPEFLSAVQELIDAVKAFGHRLEGELQAVMDAQRAALVDAFWPRLAEAPPEAWVSSSGRRPNAQKVKELLDRELARACGPASSLIRHMEVRVLFKGVTYEMLTSTDFTQACARAGLDLDKLQERFEAVRGSTDGVAG